jgi:hypothetical protein
MVSVCGGRAPRGLPTIDSFGNDELKQIIMGLPDELVEIGIELIY